MWTPDWLYERLPHLYVVAAVACLMVFGVTVAAGFSALLFCLAAAMTALRRRRARAQGARAASPRAARR